MADYIYTGKPNTSFDTITVGTKFYDLRNMVGFGILQVSSKVETGEESRHYIVATNLVTGQIHNIPKRDFWAYTV